jgi:hypothetical protein
MSNVTGTYSEVILIVNTFFGEISGWQQTPRKLVLRC